MKLLAASEGGRNTREVGEVIGRLAQVAAISNRTQEGATRDDDRPHAGPFIGSLEPISGSFQDTQADLLIAGWRWRRSFKPAALPIPPSWK